MLYHIGRNGQQVGQYSLPDLQAGYASGKFLPDDLVWREGMANWIPLQQLSELSNVTPAPSPDADELMPEDSNPPEQFTPPVQGVIIDPESDSESSSPRSGPAWENLEEGNVFERAWKTIRSIFATPAEFFATLRVDGGLGQPLLFYIFVGWIALAINTFLEAPLQWLWAGSSQDAMKAVLTPMLMVIFAPLFIAVGAFVSAGLTHLCLMLLGAANRPFEATFRVNCYAYGGVMPISIIPFCGAFIGSLWGIVLEIIGIAATHRISTGKAALAVLLPVILCCGAVGGLLLAIFGAAIL